MNIGTGDNHCTAVTESGAVYAWGFGESGQIGNADKDSGGEDAQVPFKYADSLVPLSLLPLSLLFLLFCSFFNLFFFSSFLLFFFF